MIAHWVRAQVRERSRLRHDNGTPMGDGMQLPGSFVIKDGIVVYAHRGRVSSDTAPIDELLGAL